jgi:hypothetical protein
MNIIKQIKLKYGNKSEYGNETKVTKRTVKYTYRPRDRKLEILNPRSYGVYDCLDLSNK